MQDTFKRDIWISVGVILGTLIISSVALVLISSNMQGVVAAILARRSAVASEDVSLEDLVDLKQNAALAATYQAAMDKLLPSEDALISFSNQIEALAQADGVSTSFAFQGSATAATATVPGSINFTLSATGPISNVISFMKDFESSAPILLSSLNTFTVVGTASDYTLAAQGTAYFK